MRPYLFVIFWITCTLLVGCRQKTAANETDEEIYIPVEQSELYVRLIGNPNAPLIVNLHGGPGGFSGFDHELNRKYLEKDYLIAYLDQRGCGKSAVENDSTMLNMEQAVKDLDIVVDSLKQKFPQQKINLLGGSWGGTLGLLYMIKHQDKINAFACVSGKADGIYPIKNLIQYEKERVQDKINSSHSRDSLGEYQKMMDKLIQIEHSSFDSLYEDINLLKFEYPEKLGFNVYWANKEALQKAVAQSEDSAYYQRAKYTSKQFREAAEKGEYVNRVFRNNPAYNHLNILDDLSKIHKPVLVLQGDQDYVIGPGQAQMIYNALKNVPEAKKKIHLLKNAAHNLNMEAEKEYYRYIRQFFDREN